MTNKKEENVRSTFGEISDIEDNLHAELFRSIGLLTTQTYSSTEGQLKDVVKIGKKAQAILDLRSARANLGS